MSESENPITDIAPDDSTVDSDGALGAPEAVVAQAEPGDALSHTDAADPAPQADPPAPSPTADIASEQDSSTAPDPMLVVLERFEDRLEESQRLLARQSEIATSLHAENQRLKAGELRGALMPIARDVIRVRDVLLQILATECAEASPEQREHHPLHVASEALRDALERNGIEEVLVAAGEALDPRRHKVVGVAAVDDAAAHRTIAEVLKIGFVWDDGGPIRATEVRVYKHVPPAQPDGVPEVAPDDAAEAQS